MSHHTRLCPVCRRPVTPTRAHNICGHLDQAGHPCPASWELPYEHTLQEDERR